MKLSFSLDRSIIIIIFLKQAIIRNKELSILTAAWLMILLGFIVNSKIRTQIF